MFSGIEDQDDLFAPTASNHLSSLFGGVKAAPENRPNLTYTAPKQPTSAPNNPQSDVPKPQSSLICYKLIEAYKLIGSNYVPNGKCGLAIIGNQSLKSYDVIIYRGKQDVIARSKLNESFIFTIQNNNFAAFSDDQKEKWCARFESFEDLKYFKNQVQLRNGKVVDSTLTDSNAQTNSQPAKHETNLVSEKRKSSFPSVLQKEETDFREDSSSETRANILTRMAKMGQAILPKLPTDKSAESDNSTSGVEEEFLNKRPARRKLKHTQENIAASSTKSSGLHHENTITPNSSLTGVVPTYTAHNLVANPLQGAYLQNICSPMLNQLQLTPSDHLNILVAENRTHNCEIRMNLSQLSSKLDKVLSTIENKSCSSSEKSNVNELEMELKTVQAELAQCKSTLEQFKQQENGMENKYNDMIRELNEKMQLLTNENSNLKSSVSELAVELATARNISRIGNTSQQDENSFIEKINELNQKLENKQSRLNFLENFYEDNKNVKRGLDESNWEIKSLETQLKDYEVKTNAFSDKLKDSMNKLYQETIKNFESDGDTFQAVQIKAVLASKIKKATFDIIKQFELDFKGVDETDPKRNTS